MELRSLDPISTDQPCACCTEVIPAYAPRMGDYLGDALAGILCQACAHCLYWLDLAQDLRALAGEIEAHVTR